MELLEIAKEILAANPDASLSGSVALQLQNVGLRRAPKDIDLYLPFEVGFKVLPGMGFAGGEATEDDHYENEFFERHSFKYKDVNIDVLNPVNTSAPSFQKVEVNGVRCIDLLDIIRMKVSHAFGDHFSRYKHRADVIYMMIDPNK